MFSKKNLIILSIIEFTVILGLLWTTFSNTVEKQRELWFSQSPIKQEQNKESEWKKDITDCKQETIEYIVNGNSMEPFLLNGSKVKVQEWYYACGGKIERWDIVIYQSAATKSEIIKQVRVIPGDVLALDEKTGTLKIAGEIMKNSQGEIYHFDINERRFLSLYIVQNKKTGDELTGKMQDSAYFIFGDNTTNSIDSRKIGAVGKDGFIGKVISKVK